MAILKDTIVQGDLSVTGRIGGTFKNIKIVNSSDVEETTIVAGATDDTVIFKEGAGIDLTGDATNDKLTISANAASTSAAGIVQLSSATNSAAENTAATSKAVKAAYDKGASHDGKYYSKTEIDSKLSGTSGSGHTHGNITNDGKLTTASRIVVTDTNKNITVGSIDPANLVLTSDSRLSDSRTPKSHTHGNITNDGKLATAGAVVVTNDKKELFASTAISTTELSYLSGVESNIQDQLDGKAITSHSHEHLTFTDKGSTKGCPPDTVYDGTNKGGITISYNSIGAAPAYDHGTTVPTTLTNGKLFFLHD